MKSLIQRSSSLRDKPGIYYDGQLRIFSLRCKDSLYAFRVDDARNLEHLYWGPPIRSGDDLTYLIRSHIGTPFDPKGMFRSEEFLNLEELGKVDNVEDITDKWKVFTRQCQHDGIQETKRIRRLENASWRLWYQQRRKGGDQSASTAACMTTADDNPIAHSCLTCDSSCGTVKLPDTGVAESDLTSLTLPQPKLFDSVPRSEQAKPGGWKMSRKPVRNVDNITALAGEDTALAVTCSSHRFAILPERPQSPVTQLSSILKKESSSLVKRKSLHIHGSATCPRMTLGGSVGDPNIQKKTTNWEVLGPKVMGKGRKLLEFSDRGTGDYRDPSFNVVFVKDGSSVCPIQYKGHQILEGKIPMPSPMPSMYTDEQEEATTLIVEMEDKLTGLRFQLLYTVMHNYDIICRRTVVINGGTSPVSLRHVASGTCDFDAEGDHYMTQLAGCWARERHVITQKLEYGSKVVKSARGASSHQINPHIIISPTEEPAEDHGECFGFTLVYSGNFAATCEMSEFGRLRVNMGINPDGFTWYLDTTKTSNTFHSPELVMSYSHQGLGGLSRTLHRAFRERLVPRPWRYKVPPILINTWEASYFDVNHEDVLEIAQSAAKANVELLVLDDGWFENRHGASSGLGDWHADSSKFPFGIDGIARAVNEIGLKFGVWMEPEMVSLDSDLFRKHSDWCLCVPTRSKSNGRNQLVLDFSRKVVREYIYEQLFNLINGANIEYVKWDMNRHLTEVFSQEWHASRQGEIFHRFTLGVYEVLGKLTEAFPNVLFETCSGGGGRFDAGMLYFAPQIWTSDNTDALSRVCIQYGTSLAYPASAMGAHVSTVPNHQTLRSTPMKTRSLVAMSGTYGYELDPRKLSEADFAEIRGYVEIQKRVAPIIYEGDMYRLWSPFKSDAAAWMFVSRDQQRAVVIGVSIRCVVGKILPRLKLKGLSPDVTYRVEELCPNWFFLNLDNGAMKHDPDGVYHHRGPRFIGGQTLQNAGLPVKFSFDADSFIFELCSSDGPHAPKHSES